MGSSSDLRGRRSAAERQALAGVEREIRSQDHNGQRKYLREFSQAYRSYESLLNSEQVHAALLQADVVLIGDYHALPAAQRYAGSLIEQRAMAGGRPVVLGVETIFARDQHILDEWWRRDIGEAELRQRVRFDLDWGYDWKPFYELLSAARDHGHALYGLDCMPREDLRKIGARDRHAAIKIAEIRERHPSAVIFVLFGESHLAPGHLPIEIRKLMPEARVLTVLQNVDELYWRAAGERASRVDAVQVEDDVVCVFNSTPLEKYESYRLFLDQWSRADSDPDFAPTIYNLIDSLAGFLEIDRYSPHNTTQPKFLVDMMPEVHGRASDAVLRRLLTRQNFGDREILTRLAQVEQRGSAYLPQVNAVYVREFQMKHAAEDAARFLHHACRGLPRRRESEETPRSASDEKSKSIPRRKERDKDGAPSALFHQRVVEHAVATFGSRVLYPNQAVAKEEEAVSFAAYDRAAKAGGRYGAEKFDVLNEAWGTRLGSLLYEAYLRGRVSKSELRRLFLAHLDKAGAARRVCAAIFARTRKRT